MKLDERLSLCAQMVRDGAAVADIGTDHAYLPVYLVECGKIHKAIAADVREGPLENAKGNISKNGFDQQIKTVLSDGLEKISPDEADDIVIAGMGGELIIRIISAAAWLKDSLANTAKSILPLAVFFSCQATSLPDRIQQRKLRKYTTTKQYIHIRKSLRRYLRLH